MAFLLRVAHQDDGTVHAVYDVDPTHRVTVVVPLARLDEVLSIPAEQLLYSVSTVAHGRVPNRRHP